MEPVEPRALTCAEVDEDGLAEAYLLGRLEDDTRDAFEAHYFGCSACFERLEALKLMGAAAHAEAAAGPTRLRGSRRLSAAPRWSWLAAAASLAGVAVMTWYLLPGPARVGEAPPSSGPPSTPAPALRSLAELGRFEPPPYRATTLRGSATASQARFREAMRRYQERDCAGALPGLDEAVRLDARAPAPLFFLGVCRLLTGQVAAGNESLRRVLELGDTPYLEWAHLHLARGLLLAGDAPAALEQLDLTIGLQGDLEDDARHLASRVKAAAASAAPDDR